MIWIFLMGIFGAGQLKSYTLSDYLEEVKSKNKSLQASLNTVNGVSLRSDEVSLMFEPAIFFNGQYANDQRVTNAPGFQGTQSIRSLYQLGVAQQFRTGLKASLSYNVTHTIINGASPTVLPYSNFYDMAPQIEVSQSFLRNWAGKELKATENLARAQVDLETNIQKMKYKQILLTAEMYYYRLALAQKNVLIQKESLERARRLHAWNQERVGKGLSDQEDLFQTSTGVKAREVDYQSALLEEKSAARAFNNIRESEGEVFAQKLQMPSDVQLKKLTLKDKMTEREDLQISYAEQKLVEAKSDLGKEKNKANLEIYGSYSLNGRAANSNNAWDNSFNNNHPLAVVGVRFTSPLDFSKLNKNSKGYDQEKVAAKLNLDRKISEQELEWQDLQTKLKDNQEKLSLASKMEEIQKQKLEAEKARMQRGRSTMFQVLQFEQDYANAQLLKLKNQSDIVSVYAQLKLFSEVKYE